MARYSEGYLLTVTPSSVSHYRKNMKVWLDKLNKILRDEGYGYRYRIVANHRLGQKNPNRNLYPRYGAYRVRAQHAVRSDLYLQRYYLRNNCFHVMDDVPQSTFNMMKDVLKEVCWRGHYIEV